MTGVKSIWDNSLTGLISLHWFGANFNKGIIMKKIFWMLALAAFILPQYAIAQEDEWADESAVAEEAAPEPAPVKKAVRKTRAKAAPRKKAAVQPVEEEEAGDEYAEPEEQPAPRAKQRAPAYDSGDEWGEEVQPRRRQRAQPAYNNYNRKPRANYDSGSDSKIKFLLDLRPGNFGMADGLEGFYVKGINCYYSTCYSYKDEVTSGFMWIPTVNAGVGINMPMMEIDVTGGFGLFMAGGMIGYTGQADVAARFKLGDKATVGPHLGLIYISPTWYGAGYTDDTDVIIDGATGIMIGGSFTVGKKVAFVMSIDKLIMSEMAVTPAYTTTTYDYVDTPSTLDLSGWLFQLGVMFRLGK